jgi:hypothetical protein
MEGVLQFLEAAQQGEVSAEDPLVLAAIRALGRCACFWVVVYSLP